MKWRAFLSVVGTMSLVGCGFIENPAVDCRSPETQSILADTIRESVRVSLSEAGESSSDDGVSAVSIDVRNHKKGASSSWRGRANCEASFVATYPNKIDGIISEVNGLKSALQAAGYSASENELYGVIQYESSLTGYQKSHVVTVAELSDIAGLVAGLRGPVHRVEDAGNVDLKVDEVEVEDVSVNEEQPLNQDQNEISGNVERRGPSFDCAKAATNVELMVCDDQELSDLDVRLADAYRLARQSGQDRLAVKRDQVEWLRNVLGRCEDSQCVRDAYVARIQALSY